MKDSWNWKLMYSPPTPTPNKFANIIESSTVTIYDIHCIFFWIDTKIHATYSTWFN